MNYKTKTKDNMKKWFIENNRLVKIRGKYWLMGYQNGVRAINGAMNTGKAFGDMNGITVTLQGKEPTPAYNISATASGFPV